MKTATGSVPTRSCDVPLDPLESEDLKSGVGGGEPFVLEVMPLKRRWQISIERCLSPVKSYRVVVNRFVTSLGQDKRLQSRL